MARIRTYNLKDDGTLAFVWDHPFETYGECPNVGDTLCESNPAPVCYSVVHRYLFSFFGWVVLLREVEMSQQMAAVIEAWHSDNAFFEEMDTEEESRLEEVLFSRLMEQASAEKAAKKRDTTRSKKRMKTAKSSRL